MRLLIFTQKIDEKDTVLGFFCGWVSRLAEHFDSIAVICLEEGSHQLPANVTVYSLGKERGTGRLGIVANLYHYLFLIRGQYDAVFVHMNQEYIVLAGMYWSLLDIPVYFWRNHPYGNLWTRMAIMLSTKVFSTSPQSFAARFSKTKIMPAGIDLDIFHPVAGALRKTNSVCMIGRIAPIKGIHVGLEVVRVLIESGTQISLDIIGSALPEHEAYERELVRYVEQNNLGVYVHFIPAVAPSALPEIYSTHDVCLNLTQDGSFDKTIVEAAACGAIPVVANLSLAQMLPAQCITERKPHAIAATIVHCLQAHERVVLRRELESFAESHGLVKLTDMLVAEISNV